MSMRLTILVTGFMTVMMTAVLSAWFTLVDHGLDGSFPAAWLDRAVSTFLVVLPTVVVVAPIARALATAVDRRIGHHPAE